MVDLDVVFAPLPILLLETELRPGTVPRAGADWLLLTVSVLLKCVGAYAVRDTPLKTFGGMPPGASEGPSPAKARGLACRNRVIDSPGKPEAFVCYEAPDDEHTWAISGGEGTYAVADWGTEIQDVPPAKCQTLQLKGPLEGRTLVEVTSLEGMPDCRAVKDEDYEACDKKIGDTMIRGPWRFEFKVPDSAGGARRAREADSGGDGA
jgi:hypothetical protein